MYCLPVFGGLHKNQIHDLQTLQNKAIRIVCNSPPRSNRAELFEYTGWLTVNQLASFHSLLTMFKIRTNKDPKYLADILCDEGRYGRVKTQNPVLSLTANSFCFRTSREWNKLPLEIRTELKIGPFKQKLKIWVQQNIERFVD